MALNSGTNPDRSFFSDPRRSPLPDPHRSPLSDPRRSLLGFAKSPSRGGAGVAGPTAHLLTLLPTLHARFKRNDEIDSLNQADFERSLTTPPPITAKEDAIVTNAIAVDAVDGNDESATWQRITGTIKSSVEYYHKTINDVSGALNWGKAVAIVDASAATVFAYQFGLESYENSRINREVEGANALWSVVTIPNSREKLTGSVVKLGLGVSDRVFSVRFVWRREEGGGFVLAFEPTEGEGGGASGTGGRRSMMLNDIAAKREALKRQREVDGTTQDARVFAKDMEEVQGMIDGLGDAAAEEDGEVQRRAHLQTLQSSVSADPLASKAIRGTVRGFWRFKPLAPSVCQVTYVLAVTLGGSIPRELLALRKKQSLEVMQRMQDKYERAAKTVDAEIRASFPAPPALADLSSSRSAVIANGKKLSRAAFLRRGWEPLPFPDPFVETFVSYPANELSRAVATGKASADIDCSTQEVFLWWAHWSREKIRDGYAKGDLALMCAQEDNTFDKVTAAVKSMPFFLQKREFVGRQVCALDADGSFVVAAEPVDDIMDYGARFRTVRGEYKSYTTFTPISDDRCKVTMFVNVDAKGSLPVFVVNSNIAKALSPVGALRERFQRDAEIDSAERGSLAGIIRDEPQTYSSEEDILFNSLHAKLGVLRWSSFDDLESPDHLVKMGTIVENGTSGIGRASVVVDASVFDCAAWEVMQMGRKRLRDHGRLERSLTKVNDHHGIFYAAYDFGIPGFQPREFLQSQVWRLQGDKLTAVYHSVDRADVPPNPLYVRGTSTTHSVYEKLQPVGDLPQTRMTFTQQVDLGGLIPKSIVNGQAVNQLMYLSTIRMRFDRSLEMDKGVRKLNVAMIQDHSGEYSEEEKNILAAGEKHFADFREMRAKSLKLKSPLARAEIAYKSGDRHAWGWSSTIVRASPKEVLAFLWDTMRRSARREDDLEKAVDEKVNDHNMVIYNHKKTPKIIADRDFLGRVVWRAEDLFSRSFILVASPTESAKRSTETNVFGTRTKQKQALTAEGNPVAAPATRTPSPEPSAPRLSLKERMTQERIAQGTNRATAEPTEQDMARSTWLTSNAGTGDVSDSLRLRQLKAIIAGNERRVVRAAYPSALRIKRKSATETTIEYVIHPDAGGNFPNRLMARYMKSNLQRVSEVQEYFQALRELKDWDVADAEAVGEALCIKTKTEKLYEKGESKKAARVRELFKMHVALAEIAKKYEFFQPMITRVVENKLRRETRYVKSKLCNVSVGEGRTIGRSLAMELASNLTAEAAVDAWILQFRALRELDKEEEWFRPMLIVVAKRLLGEVSWGLKLRVLMGAGLSILDMATDVFVIVGYWGSVETKGYGWSLLGMIAASMVLQLLIVFGQHRKAPSKMLGEMLIVLTGLKPGFDAANVIMGKEMGEHSVFDAKIELVACKAIEMFCESIPGCILQLYAIFQSGERQDRAIISVAVSALATGFSSASISFDLDVDPASRKKSPDFYGYIPDDGRRTVIFVCMILNSSLLLLLRSLSAAMLMLAQKRYLMLYMAGDMALYLLQKMARGDFHYWFPVDGLFGLSLSLLLRVIVKTLTDFTGSIHFRSPQELGGMYWTLNMFLALVATVASVWIYVESGGDESGGGEVAGGEAWSLVGYMGGGWVVTFALFLLLMKHEYRRTFFSTKTAKQQIMDRFEVEDEAVRASVVTKNAKMWPAIRLDVKEWVQASWWRWKEEKPIWMTEGWVAKLPKEWIPTDEDREIWEEAKGEEFMAMGGEKGRRRDGKVQAVN